MSLFVLIIKNFESDSILLLREIMSGLIFFKKVHKMEI